jgi:ETC complex I subunit conserved region
MEDAMNIELKPRIEPFMVPTVLAANDNPLLRPQSPPQRQVAVIYRPAKSAMTSGRAGTKRWLLEFAPQSPPFIEPLMGWTGSTDPLSSVRLSFPNPEAAVAYAQRQGWDCEVRDPQRGMIPSPPIRLSYSETAGGGYGADLAA